MHLKKYPFFSICFILGLGSSLLGCQPPTEKPQDSKISEELGTLTTEITEISLFSEAIKVPQINDPQVIREFYARLNFNSQFLNFELYCSNESPLSDSLEIPEPLKASLEMIFSEAKLCRLRFEFDPSNENVTCLAAILPLAEVKLADGSSLSLSRQGSSICHQELTYFCDPNWEEKFIDSMKSVEELIPKCQ
ncbi:MAG: hypothetical protein KDD35_05880 [Bdellovibrionales bacterium]|nr:hypothetical protein [Bdellovibrionales bacterium]